MDMQKEYVTPVIRIIPLRTESGICSPLPGGSEDIGYEDWD